MVNESTRTGHLSLLVVAAAVMVLAAVVAYAGGQGTGTGSLSAELRAHVAGEKFGIVTAVRGLPLGVRNSLQALFGNASLDIADSGADFQGSGGKVDRSLPSRRLVTAGCSTDHCLVYYEIAGSTRGWRVAVFHWTPDATRFEWGATAPQGLTSIESVRKFVLSGTSKGETRRW
jgi:hypothetical protein